MIDRAQWGFRARRRADQPGSVMPLPNRKVPCKLVFFCLLNIKLTLGARCLETVDIDVGLAACAKTRMLGTTCQLVEVSAPANDHRSLEGCYVPAGKSDESRVLYRLHGNSGETATRYLYYYQAKWVMGAKIGAHFLAQTVSAGTLPPTSATWLLRRRGRWRMAEPGFSVRLVEYSPERKLDLKGLLWTTVSSLPTARSAAAGATVRDDLFVFGGAECECSSGMAAACPDSYSACAESFNSVSS